MSKTKNSILSVILSTVLVTSMMPSAALASAKSDVADASFKPLSVEEVENQPQAAQTSLDEILSDDSVLIVDADGNTSAILGGDGTDASNVDQSGDYQLGAPLELSVDEMEIITGTDLEENEDPAEMTDGEEGDGSDLEGNLDADDGEDGDGEDGTENPDGEELEDGEEEEPEAPASDSVRLVASWIDSSDWTELEDLISNVSFLRKRYADSSAQSIRYDLEVQLLGDDIYNVGDIMVTIPKYIIAERGSDVASLGKLNLSVPLAPDSKAVFAYSDLGDSYVISNARRVQGGTSPKFQFTISDIPPLMVNGNPDSYNVDTMPKMIATATIGGSAEAVPSNPLAVVFDTEITAVDASLALKEVKSGSEVKVPSNLMPANPEGYTFYSYYAYGKAVGNQGYAATFTHEFTDLPEGALILGAVYDNEVFEPSDADPSKIIIESSTIAEPSTSLSGFGFTNIYIACPTDAVAEVDVPFGYTMTLDVEAADDRNVLSKTVTAKTDVKPEEEKPIEIPEDYFAFGVSSASGSSTYGLGHLAHGRDISLTYSLRSMSFAANLSWEDLDEDGQVTSNEVGQRAFTTSTRDIVATLGADEGLLAGNYEIPYISLSKGIETYNYAMATSDMTGYKVSKSAASKVQIKEGDYGYLPSYESVDFTVYAKSASSTDWERMADFTARGSYAAATEVYNGAYMSGTNLLLPSGMIDIRIDADSTTTTAFIAEAYITFRIKGESEQMQAFAQDLIDRYEVPSTSFRASASHSISDADGNQVGSTMSRSGSTTISGVATYAGAANSMKYRNDTSNARIVVTTSASAHDVTNLSDKTEYEWAIKDGEVERQTRGTFYDLLPLGADIDTDSMSTAVHIISKQQIRNWRDSGRTMVIVEFEFPKAPSSWRALSGTYGYGQVASFNYNIYIPWRSINDYGPSFENIVAFEFGNDYAGSVTNYIGEPDDPRANNHISSRYAVNNTTYPLMKSLRDGQRDDCNSFVYASASITPTVDMAALPFFSKEVSSLNGRWSEGALGQDAVNANEGAPYSYKIVAENDSSTRSWNMILFDRLESYAPTTMDAGDLQWKGTFTGVDTYAMSALGADPKVYWSSDSSIANPGDLIATEQDAESFSFQTAGWHPLTSSTDTSQVRAIAIDLRTAADGTRFELAPGKMVTAYVNMVAPSLRNAAEQIGYEGNPTDLYDSISYAEAGIAGGAHAYNSAFLIQTTSKMSEIKTTSHEKTYTKLGISPFQVNVEVLFSDGTDQDDLRPEEVVMRVEAKTASGVEAETQYITLSDDNSWKDYFKASRYDVDTNEEFVFTATQGYYGEDGEFCAYESGAPEGYDVTTTYSFSTDTLNIVASNLHSTAQVKVEGQKVWSVDPNRYPSHKLPPVVIFDILDRDSGKVVKTVSTTAVNAWKFEASLPRYDKGVEIAYDIVEQYLPGYTSEIEVTETEQDNDCKTMSVLATNTYAPYTDLTITATPSEDASEKACELAEFTITPTILDANDEIDPNSYSWETEDGTRSGTFANGSSITLRANETINVQGVASESTITVEQSASRGWTLIESESNMSASIRSQQPASINLAYSYEAKTAFSMDVRKELKGRELMARMFKFEVLVPTEQGGMQPAFTGTNGADGKVALPTITFKSADDKIVTERYVREANLGAVGYEYSDRLWLVRMIPSDNGDGTMSVKARYYDVTETTAPPIEDEAIEDLSDEIDDGSSEGAPDDAPDDGVAKAEKYATFVNTYGSTGKVSPKAWMTLLGGTISDVDPPFTFELYKVTDEGRELVSRVGCDEDGNIVFDELEFTIDDTGRTHTYVATQVNGGVEGITYSDKEFTYTIEVIDNGNGMLSVNVTTDEVPIFENRLAPGSLTVTKYIEDGNEGATHNIKVMFEGTNLADMDWSFERRQVSREDAPLLSDQMDAERIERLYNLSNDDINVIAGQSGQGDEGTSAAASSASASDRISSADSSEEGTSSSSIVIPKPAPAPAQAQTEGTASQQSVSVPDVADVTVEVPRNVWMEIGSSCLWMIDDKGKLSVRARNGREGQLPTNVIDEKDVRAGDASFWPWHEVREDVTEIEFAETVKLDGSARAMFEGFTHLVKADLSGLDTEKIINVSRMFYGCEKMEALLANSDRWDLSSIEKPECFEDMFFDCKKLTGNNGTRYDREHANVDRACFDSEGNAGYVTDTKKAEPTAEVAANESNADSSDGKTEAAGSAPLRKPRPTVSTDAMSTIGTLPAAMLGEDYALPAGSDILSTSNIFSSQSSANSGISLLAEGDEDRTIKYQGTVGTCIYVIYSDGEMVVQPIEGLEVGELPASPFAGTSSTNYEKVYPWVSTSKKNSITSVRFDGRVTINGPGVGMFYYMNNVKSFDLSNFDTTGLTSAAYMFYYASVKTIDLSFLSAATHLDSTTNMFNGASSLTSIDLSPLANAADLKDMSYMFSYCYNLTSIDLSVMHLENKPVENMRYMLSNCQNLVETDLTNAVSSSVTDITGMFCYSNSLVNLDLSTWDTSNVESMSRLFAGSDFNYQKLKTVDFGTVPDTKFTTAKVKDFSYMFSNCKYLTKLDLRSFDTSSATTMRRMFSLYPTTSSYTSPATLEYLLIDREKFTTANVENMEGMFGGCQIKGGIDISNWDTSKVTDMSSMFLMTCDTPITFASEDGTSKFTGKSVTSVYRMFYNSTGTEVVDLRSFETSSQLKDCREMFEVYMCVSSPKTKKILFDPDLFDTSSITSMIGMFYYQKALEEVNVSGFKTSSVVTFEDMFYQCSALKSLDVRNFDLRSASKTYRMFYYCSSLADLDTSNFITTKLTNASSMFAYCPKLEKLDVSGIAFAQSATSTVTTASSMFAGCTLLSDLIFTKEVAEEDGTATTRTFDTHYVVNMAGMFASCESLPQFDFSLLDTVNAQTMSNLFSGCLQFTNIDRPAFVTNRVTNMGYMFRNCSNLQSVNLSNFETPELTDMQYMFAGCSKLETVNLSSFNTEKVTTMAYMFQKDEKLISVDLSNFKTPLLTSMSFMFSECTKLESVDLSGFVTPKLTTMEQTFNYCKALKAIDLHNFVTPSLTSLRYTFYNCSSMRFADLSNIITSSNTAVYGTFSGTPALQEIRISNSFAIPSGGYVGLSTLTAGKVITDLYTGEEGTTTGKWVRDVPTPGGPFTTAELTSLWNSDYEAVEGTWVQQVDKQEYYINFDPNGGVGTSSMTVKIGKPYTLPECEAYYFDHTFIEWNTKADGTGTSYQPGVEYTTDLAESMKTVTLYAIWEQAANEAVIEDNTISFALHGNESATFSSIPAGTRYTVWEEVPDGWKCIDSDQTSGAIMPAAEDSAYYTNKYDPESAQAMIRAKAELDETGFEGLLIALYTVSDIGADITGSPIETVTTDAAGMAAFVREYDKDQVGEHYYAMAMVADPEHPEVAIDPSIKYVKVTVEEGGSVLIATVEYIPENPVFSNSTKPGTLTISREIDHVGQLNESAARQLTFAISITFTSTKIGIDDTTETYHVAMAGDDFVISDVAAGSSYSVNSIEPPSGYTLVSDISEMTGTIGADENATITPLFSYGSSGETAIQIRKVLEGGILAGNDFAFEVFSIGSGAGNDSDGDVESISEGGEKGSGEEISDENGIVDSDERSDSSEDTSTMETMSAEGSAIPSGASALDRTLNDDTGSAQLFVSVAAEDLAGSDSFETRYIVREDPTPASDSWKDGSVAMDGTEHQIAVRWSDDGQGRLVGEVIYDLASASDGAITFTNSVKTGTLTIHHRAENITDIHKDRLFEIGIELTDANGEMLEPSYWMISGADAGEPETQSLPLDEIIDEDEIRSAFYDETAFDQMKALASNISSSLSLMSSSDSESTGISTFADDSTPAMPSADEARANGGYAGSGKAYMKDGHTIQLTVPAGTSFVVTQAPVAGFKLSATGDTGTLNGDDEAVCELVKTYEGHGSYYLMAKKSTVDYTLVGSDFEFEAKVTSGSGNGASGDGEESDDPSSDDPPEEPGMAADADEDDASNADVLTARNDDLGNVVFPLQEISLDQVGKTIIYEIAEIDTEIEDVEYDEAKFTAEVEIIDADEGNLEAHITYKDAGGNVVDEPEFVNIYHKPLDLPLTGESGGALIAIIGFAFVAVFAAFIVIGERKRRKEDEDEERGATAEATEDKHVDDK